MNDDNADVLVAGAGAAGMTAALVARSHGLSVLIVEATQQVGGTTSTSAGTLWLPTDDDAARAYLHAAIGPAADDRKIDALLETGAALLTFLREKTQVRLDPVPVHPDYLQALPGATLGGRAHAPREFDGRRLGANFARVRPPLPEFMVFGGMMVSKADIPLLLSAGRSAKGFAHAMRLLSRYAVDRLRGRRGTRLVMGNALVAQLFASTLDAGVRFAFGTSVAGVEPDGQAFLCRLDSGDGERRLRVGKAIVLATGGYSGNAQMRAEWMEPAARGFSVAHPGNGGGIALGRSIGGAVETGHAQPAFWMPLSTMQRDDGSLAVFPHIVLDRAKPGSLAVDAQGRRFTNEADSYHHFCEAMLAHSRNAAQRFFLVADRAFIRSYGIGIIRPGGDLRRHERSGYLVTATSPGELAAKLGLDAGTFEQTLQRYNAQAALGSDPDFRRGESALNRHNGDPAHAPNPCLRPVDTTQLCAVELHVADLATSIGLATDSHARVLDERGKPIAGLYACGNDMASMMRGSYPGPGTTLGPGMAFAFRAMDHLAANCASSSA